MDTQPSPRLAAAVAERLAAACRDVVICPGSRNAPLSIALLKRRELRVHTRLDERSAAFLALGIARASRRPAAVVTTSGTAAANCLPAVAEAAHSHSPLVVVTADRPSRYVGTGASQTIEQDGIFSSFAATRSGEELAAGEIDLEVAGPVHVNVPLDVPLVAPEEPPAAGEASPAPRRPVAPAVDRGSVKLDLSRDTLVVAGDEAWDVEGLEDVPTIAEPSAPAPAEPVHPLAAGIFRRGSIGAGERSLTTRPEQLVVVGHPTLHRDVLALMADPGIDVTVLSRTGTVTDPEGNAARNATRVEATGSPEKRWLALAREASSLAADAVREVLADQDGGLTGLHAAAILADGLAVGDGLFVAASNPVRDVSLAGLPFGGVDVYTPRGTAGIDGSVSQAIGVALARQTADPTATRAPRTLALIGDVAFLHDAGGLLSVAGSPEVEDLTIVVANDDGGGIFETLEVGAEPLRGPFERAFGTPHGADIGALCRAFGVDHELVDDAAALAAALDERAERPRGLNVVEVATDRASRRTQASRLHELVLGEGEGR